MVMGETLQPPDWGPSYSNSLDSDPPTWGPSHSIDTDEEDGATAGTRNEETWTTFLANMFNCGGDLAPEELEELELEIEEDPFFGATAVGGCISPFSNKSKSKKRDPKMDISGETTRRDDSNESLMGANPTTRAWSSPPRLHHGKAGALLDECGFTYLSNDKPNKILDDAFYFSDMDTFLSDDFTVMEQGFFNHLYDQICKPVNTRRKRGVGSEAPNAVLLSFDDTLSKLTADDGQRSLSTMSLNTFEQLKKKGVDNAAIAAIVKAQADAGWESRAQEEAEAKAEELTHWGVEHTLAELDIPSTEPTSTEPGNVVYVHYHTESKEDEDETPREEKDEVRANFPSEANHNRLVYSDQSKSTSAESKPTKTFAKKFLKNPFRRSKKKNNNSFVAGKPPISNLDSDVTTPPRDSKAQPTARPSPTTSTTGFGSVSAESQKPKFEVTNQYQTPEEEDSPTRPKEPAKTPHIQILSNQELIGNVEILRQESRISSAPFDANDDMFGALEEKKEDLADLPTWVQSERKLEAPEFDDFTSCSSMEQQSLATMTSRLKEEREETERLRKMLEEKDEDLERLKELLRSNESSAIMERFNSSAQPISVKE